MRKRKTAPDEAAAVERVGDDGDDGISIRPTLSRARGAWQSEERIAALIAMLEQGIPLRASCAALRIPETSLREKMAVDPELCDWVNDARASAEARHVAKVAVADDWKASAWWLERRAPDEWAPPKERREVSGPGGGPVQLAAVDAVDRMSPEELSAAARALLDGGR